MTARALRLAPEPEPELSAQPVTAVALAGRMPQREIVIRAAAGPLVLVAPAGSARLPLATMLAAARRSDAGLEVVHVSLVGLAARYLESVGRSAAAEGWTAREIVCLLAELERRTQAWVVGPGLPLPAGRRPWPPVRRAARFESGRWRAAPSAPAWPAEMTQRGLAAGATCLTALSGAAPSRSAAALFAAWTALGARGGRQRWGLARDLGMRWTLEAVVAPRPGPAGLVALREQVAAAPRCGWCRLPVLAGACPRCSPPGGEP